MVVVDNTPEAVAVDRPSHRRRMQEVVMVAHFVLSAESSLCPWTKFWKPNKSNFLKFSKNSLTPSRSQMETAANEPFLLSDPFLYRPIAGWVCLAVMKVASPAYDQSSSRRKYKVLHSWEKWTQQALCHPKNVTPSKKLNLNINVSKNSEHFCSPSR